MKPKHFGEWTQEELEEMKRKEIQEKRVYPPGFQIMFSDVPDIQEQFSVGIRGRRLMF